MVKNICNRESYKDKQGNEKVSWPVLGVLIEANGKQYVKLHHMPGVLLSVFEPKAKTVPKEVPDVDVGSESVEF